MTVNDFIQAISDKLVSLWPDRKVYVDEIPQDADGNFFIDVVEESQSKHMGNRYKRTYQFDVAYILKKHDAMKYHDWVETMNMEFESVNVGDLVFHATNLHADVVDHVFHFMMDISFMALFIPETDDEPMEELRVFADLNINSYQSIYIVGSISLGADGRAFLYQVPECGTNQSGGL